MTHEMHATRKKAPLRWPVAAFVSALGVFVVDTLTTFEFAIAVLYVVVVLITAANLDRSHVVVTASGMRLSDNFKYCAGAWAVFTQHGYLASGHEPRSYRDYHNPHFAEHVSKFTVSAKKAICRVKSGCAADCTM
ncbi:hypothetical protein HPT29_026205 (plasmid) [Microvirga terrae]|uniref:Uncharacterized protein n=1 Tax=Microvirga terrae TaxID=2740529 RepID=A0ABY5RYV7_9HYPH|nr:hypothetical protein [Microvirga terrae]UVF22193.1 hypothetical protein HPT29_026205 [Microvirga terrae]